MAEVRTGQSFRGIRYNPQQMAKESLPVGARLGRSQEGGPGAACGWVLDEPSPGRGLCWPPSAAPKGTVNTEYGYAGLMPHTLSPWVTTHAVLRGHHSRHPCLSEDKGGCWHRAGD